METIATTRSERLARGVSYAVNPLILPPLLFGGILMQFGAPAREAGLVISALLVLMTVLPLMFLWWMVRSGRAASIEVFEREERPQPLLFGMLCALGAVACLFVLVETGRPFVLAVGICIVVNGALLGLLNLRWKISIHAAAVSGFAAILLFASYVAAPSEASVHFGWVVAAVPLVMWARIHTESHTPAEVVAGAIFGALAPLLELWAISAAGVFG